MIYRLFGKASAHNGIRRVFCVVFGLMALAARPCGAESVRRYRSGGAGVPVMVISVDMNDPNIKVTGMVTPRGRSERFETMVRRAHPTAALTGTYFGLDTRIPIGDIVVDGRLVQPGCIGTALCVTGDNQCEFIKPPRQHRADWSPFDFVCCAGPRLVCASQVVVRPRAEGFHDSGLLGHAARLAVGITAQNRLLFVATRCRISLGRLAKVMKALGCTDAINLDAGASLGFYHGGKFLVHPQRQLTNLILIYDDRQRYERFKDRLTPQLAQSALNHGLNSR